jgi:CxxC-x17-CxxC domain-containing protein
MVTAVYCASCGQKTTVPFRPTQGRPVLCRACYMGQRNVASA